MNELYVAMYHYTRDLAHSRYPEIKGLDAKLFQQQIQFFKENFTFVSMDDVLEASNGGKPLPEKSILLTFDDGYIDNYTVALPILEEAGAKGLFFIPGKTFTKHELLIVNKIHFILACAGENEVFETLKKRMDDYRGSEFDYPSNEELFQKYVGGDIYSQTQRFNNAKTTFIKVMLQTVLPERLRNILADELFRLYVDVDEEELAYELYMTKQQIRAMKRRGMDIGIHGYDHNRLGKMPKEDAIKDIEMAMECLDGMIDPKQWAMCYPYGDYNDEVLQIVKERGGCMGVTIKPGVAKIGVDSNLILPRFDCNDFPPKSNRYTEG